MFRIIATVTLLVSSATVGFSQEKCMTETDVLKYVKQQRMVEGRCYWNTNTAGSDEEFQCVRTWVSPNKTYFSVEDQNGCFVNPRTFSQREMNKLYRVKAPKHACDDCG